MAASTPQYSPACMPAVTAKVGPGYAPTSVPTGIVTSSPLWCATRTIWRRFSAIGANSFSRPDLSARGPSERTTPQETEGIAAQDLVGLSRPQERRRADGPDQLGVGLH